MVLCVFPPSKAWIMATSPVTYWRGQGPQVRYLSPWATTWRRTTNQKYLHWTFYFLIFWFNLHCIFFPITSLYSPLCMGLLSKLKRDFDYAKSPRFGLLQHQVLSDTNPNCTSQSSLRIPLQLIGTKKALFFIYKYNFNFDYTSQRKHSRC